MNEKIKELAEQATSTLSVNHEGYRGKGYIEQVEYFDKGKFAELIVAECLDQCYNRGMNDELYAGQLKAATYIEEYFGVK